LSGGGEVTVSAGKGPGLNLVSGPETAEARVGLGSSGLPPGEGSGGKGNELLSFGDRIFGVSFSGIGGVISKVVSIRDGIIGGTLGGIDGVVGNVTPVLILEGILDLGLGIVFNTF